MQQIIRIDCIDANIDNYFDVNMFLMLYLRVTMIRTNWFDKGESIIARGLQGDLLKKMSHR